VAIIDDETALVRGLSLTFEREGFRVLSAGDGEQALRLVRRERPDLVILDLMLPSVDGLDVCRRLRADDDPTVRGVPIIMLTARDDDIDKVVGLEVGADDYVTKPFNPRELVARVRAVLRRRELDRQSAEVGPETGRPAVMKSGDLVIDLAKRRVSVSGRPVSLTATEFDLLVHLAASPGRVYSREELLTSVWGYEFAGADRTVDVHVRRLREKIEPEPSSPTYVLTSWGRGYYFNDALEGGAPGRSRSARP
jgi:DNA-binding response OmpR family regulator